MEAAGRGLLYTVRGGHGLAYAPVLARGDVRPGGAALGFEAGWARLSHENAVRGRESEAECGGSDMAEAATAGKWGSSAATSGRSGGLAACATERESGAPGWVSCGSSWGSAWRRPPGPRQVLGDPVADAARLWRGAGWRSPQAAPLGSMTPHTCANLQDLDVHDSLFQRKHICLPAWVVARSAPRGAC